MSFRCTRDGSRRQPTQAPAQPSVAPDALRAQVNANVRPLFALMPLSSIVVIVIRLFALNWFVSAVPLLLSAATNPLPHERHLPAVLMPYAPAVLLLIFAAGLWILTPAIARIVSRGVDTTVSIGSLSRSDLYSFAFVFLGFFFILSSFADVINWIHYFATVSHQDSTHDPRVQNLYQLTRPRLTFVAGLISLLGAPRWTKKRVAYDHRNHVA
jgi:hypothetical protein